MKILLLGSSIATGGAQRVLLDLAGWLYQQNIAVTAAFLYDREGLLTTWRQRYPFPVVCKNFWSGKSSPIYRAWRLLTEWFGLVRWMRQEQFSAVLTFTHDSNLVGLPAAWLARIPARYGSHHQRFPTLTEKKIRLHTCIINSQIASGLVAVSSYTRAQAIEEGIRPERIEVIFNGIDLQSLAGGSPAAVREEFLQGGEGPLVLAVGRLVQPKGYAYFIQAAAQVLTAFPRAVFCIAGDGPLRGELQQMVDNLGIASRVRMVGTRTDVPDLLAACDLYVLSSVDEGLPMALLEAMASGAAVVSTRIPGVQDIIIDGETGLQVPPADAEGLARTICAALSDAPLRKQLAQNGRKLVQEKFPLVRTGQQYLELLSRKNG